MARRKIFGVTIVRDPIVLGIDLKDFDEDKLYCPSCGHEMMKYDRHHVHAYIDGGHGFKWNILAICKSCHTRENLGNGLDRVTYRSFYSRLMMAEYGLLHMAQIGKEETSSEVDKELRSSIVRYITKIANDDDISFLAAARKLDEEIKLFMAKEFWELRKLIRKGNHKALMDYWIGRGIPREELLS